MVGVLSVVMLSLEDCPVSLEASRSGTPSVVGAVVSMTIAFEFAILEAGSATLSIALPAASVTVPTVKLDTVRSGEVCPAATM